MENDNTDTTGSQNGKQERNLIEQPIIALLAAIAFGLVSIVLFSVSSNYQNLFSIIGISFLISGASFMIGGLIGFLFGIPRTLQQDDRVETTKPEDQKEYQYKVNTNLEQISDWLTKILVGVGLTQINTISSQLNSLGEALAPSLGGAPSSAAFGIVITLYFLVSGFLTGYLLTRTYITKLFRSTDEETIERLKKVISQHDLDAQALELLDKQLTREEHDLPADHQKKLLEAIKKASAGTTKAIYSLAYTARSENWREVKNKKKMEKTIPVFKALISSNRNNYEYYGQLGFALKDKLNPDLNDYKEAEEALDKAIELRPGSTRWLFFEYTRAYCKIMQDQNFIHKKPSEPLVKEAILKDLRTSLKASDVKFTIEIDDVLKNWCYINKVNIEEL